jgi:hypothetical protein
MLALGPSFMSDDPVTRFANLFRGRRDLQGTEDGGCLHKPVTFGHYRGHLQGRFGLGIFPLRDDGTCAWATVDVDQNDLDAVLQLQRLLADAGLNTLLLTSKSKGYHVTVFVDGWARAEHLRSILLEQLVEAGLPKTTEIYPRRNVVSAQSVAPGGYLRLPYPAALATTPAKNMPMPGRRVALDPKKLRPLAFEDFLERAEQGRVSPDLIRSRAEAADDDGRDELAELHPHAELPDDPAELGLQPRLADLIRMGWSESCGYRSRSEAQQATVDALVNRGYDDVTIQAVMKHPGYGISARARERSPFQAQAEIARCIHKARATSRPSRYVTGGLISTGAHRAMADKRLPPLAWPVLAEIAITTDYSTGISIMTMDSLAKRLRRSRAAIHRDAIKPLRDAGIVERVPLQREHGRWQRVGHRIRQSVFPTNRQASEPAQSLRGSVR